jgi:hypothetical protein
MTPTMMALAAIQACVDLVAKMPPTDHRKNALIALRFAVRRLTQADMADNRLARASLLRQAEDEVGHAQRTIEAISEYRGHEWEVAIHGIQSCKGR